jgi:6-phosphofructokinase 1
MQQNRSLTMEKKKIDFTIPNLGEAKIPSPIAMSESHGDGYADYVSDDDKILYSIEAKAQGGTITCNGDDYLEVAGPRAKIYFNPAHVHAAICTCGGHLPRYEQSLRAWCGAYGTAMATRISGVQFGYQGL